jgi:hypothetical protein
MRQGPDGTDPAVRMGGPGPSQAPHLLKDGAKPYREGGSRQHPRRQSEEKEK